MNSPRIAYALVALEVDRLYQKEFADTDSEGINSHCEYIAQFIQACGWEEAEFMDEYINRGMRELLHEDQN